jgi:hypothetical protein
LNFQDKRDLLRAALSRQEPGPKSSRTLTAVSQRQWALGIYTGPSPLSLSVPATVRNPVISGSDVSDVRARFVADPFMVSQDDYWYMFFEVMNQETGRGEIGLAMSENGFRWEYRQIVLREPFHLSYPHVFQCNDEYYMTPETLEVNSVNLYRADPFPTHWTHVETIIPVRCADPSIFRVDNIWWLFACSPIAKNDTLRLYYSHNLMTSWQEHPKSPIVERNARIARPAGRVTSWEGNLIRYAQDCRSRYGECVRAVNVIELAPTSYTEREIQDSPILCATSEGWNSSRMHHVDPHLTPDGLWIACVDGC